MRFLESITSGTLWVGFGGRKVAINPVQGDVGRAVLITRPVLIRGMFLSHCMGRVIRGR